MVGEKTPETNNDSSFHDSIRKVAGLVQRVAFNEFSRDMMKSTPDIDWSDQPSPDELAVQIEEDRASIVEAVEAGIAAAKNTVLAQHDADKQAALDAPH